MSGKRIISMATITIGYGSWVRSDNDGNASITASEPRAFCSRIEVGEGGRGDRGRAACIRIILSQFCIYFIIIRLLFFENKRLFGLSFFNNNLFFSPMSRRR
jgi:hypothetical protein